ncbi:protein OS-9 homolog [Lycium ferocissimum]|uniref:protein OS-9 homolog n=1 Tax=Lycium ferocissimum TaxID=112874 RepID=UPI002814CB62|nr:protein OS-9 homolog [Lycium ferocissimum]
MRSVCCWIVVFLSINVLYDVVSSSQILSAHTGASFSRSSKEPKYTVEFHSEDAPFHPDDDQETILMPNKNGEKFLCYLPKVDKPKIGKPVTTNISSLVVDTEKRIKWRTPDELLEVLKDRCLVRQEGWWSYEFCYENKLRQVHLEDEKLVQEFILGYYDAEATAAYHQNRSDNSVLKDPRSKDASQRYHAHIYTNGTICDLTNEPRQTEVRFVCSEPRAMISSITELSTCKYALTVHCPTLCKHPLFHEERPVWHTIYCNKLPKDYTETKVEEDNFENQKIDMVTDSVYQPSSDSDEHVKVEEDDSDEHANVEGDSLEDENITIAT